MFIKNKEKPVILFDKFFDLNRSENLMKYLKEEIKWGFDVYNFNGKEVKSPRKTAYYGAKDYNYSGIIKEKKKFTKSFQYLANEIEKFLEIEEGFFNGCLLNWYRDGKDSISYHTDNEPDMLKDGVITVLSVGVERKFYIKNNKTKEVVKFSLPNCSLAVMNPICQKDWQHSIPKESKVKEDRISLTFRRFI